MKATAWAQAPIVARFAALIALLLGAALVVPASAAPPPNPAAKPAPQASRAPNPVLTAKVIGGRGGGHAAPRALKIDKLDIDVDVQGRAAVTVLTATFLNPTSDTLEGDFILDMPAGSVITGYALDVEGRMVEGVLVGRRQGTQAYEARVRAGVDPGLAEVTRTGAFRTRVFPIFPGKGRTVRIEFVSPLGPDGYVLPLHTDEPVGEAALRVNSAGRLPPMALAGLQRGETVRNVRLGGSIRLPVGTASSVSAARHHSGESFVEIADTAPSTALRAPDTRRIRVYWDRSLSRRDDALDREIGLLSRYLQGVRPEAVDLITFASDRPRVQTFEGANIASRIEAALKAVEYDGATSLRDVLKVVAPAAGQCLAFTDGNVNLDDFEVRAMPCPLYTVSSANDADAARLGAIAAKSGGEHLNLRTMNTDVALTRLTSRALRVTSVTDASGAAVDYAVLPAGPNGFRIVAPAPASGLLKVQLSGQAPRSYRVPAGAPVTHDGLGALWARARLAEMAADRRNDEKALQRFARRYSVADASVVFVVLETARDYAEAEIEPPASIGSKVIAEYREMLAQRDRAKDAERNGRLEKILAMWNEQKGWWDRRFEFPKEKLDLNGRSQREQDRDSRRRARAGEATTSGPPPPPPPPPSAPPPPVMAGEAAPAADASADGVTVTGSRATRQGAGADDRPAISIEVGEWNPDRPYLKALEAVASERWPEVYRAQAREHGGTPAFYLDVAEWLHRKGATHLARAVVVNAIELPGADTSTLTILADRLMRYGDDERAIWLYEKILRLEPDRPQPRRNLALALIARADDASRSAAAWRHDPKRDYARALDLLTEVVMTPWDRRYDGIEIIALMEANRIVPVVRAGGGKVDLDPRLIALLDTDLRILLEWNTDFTDMDLWVDEPSGERAIYSHNRTVIGGRLSNDMTQGYGPEEYLLRRAMEGQYRISANVYATDRLNPNGSTTIRARIFRNWGRPDQEEQTLELELKPGEAGTRLVGTITVGPPRRRR